MALRARSRWEGERDVGPMSRRIVSNDLACQFCSRKMIDG